MGTILSRWLGVSALAWGAVACGAAGDEAADDAISVSEQALAPAGSNAQLVAASIPSPLFPGERRVATVTLRNTGTAPGANDWTASSPPYAFSALKNGFAWNYAYVPGTVPVGSEHTFSFVITAPPESQSFVGRMSAVGQGTFGDTVSAPVTIDANVTPQWSCTLLSDTVPASLAPGENRWVTATVRNTGTETWRATAMKLATRDLPPNLWGVTNADLTTAVAPGGTATFGFNLKAPATPGTYTFQREMKDYAGIGDFRNWGFCVTKTISVGGVNPLGSAIASHTIPVTFAPGETKVVSVTMQNTGTETWAADGTYLLYSRSNPVNLWGFTLRPVTAATPTNATATFWVSVKAPATPGSYTQAWQMRKGPFFFGPTLSVPITVQSAVAPYDAALVSQDFPEFMVAGETKLVSVVLRNTGSEPWPKDNSIVLASTTTPPNLWGFSVRPLSAATAPGATATVFFNITAPAPGTYPIKWQLRKLTGTSTGFFGATAERTIRTFDASVPELDAAVVSQDIPANMATGQTYPVTITMKNTGRTRWTTDVNLVQPQIVYPSPFGVFAPISAAGVAPDETKTFSFSLKAPANPGRYLSAFRLEQGSRIGQTARQEVTVSSGPSGPLPCAVPSDFPIGSYHLETASISNYRSSPSLTCRPLAERLGLTLAADPNLSGGYLATMARPTALFWYGDDQGNIVLPVTVSSDDGTTMRLHGTGPAGPDGPADSGSNSLDLDVSRSGVITNLVLQQDWFDQLIGGAVELTGIANANGWLTCASEPPGAPVPTAVPATVPPPPEASFCGPANVPLGCYQLSGGPPCSCGDDHAVSCGVCCP